MQAQGQKTCCRSRDGCHAFAAGPERMARPRPQGPRKHATLWVSIVLVGLLLCAAAALAQTPVAPMPRKVLVEDVRIQGNIQTPTHRIVPHIKTRAGQDYNEDL